MSDDVLAELTALMQRASSMDYIGENVSQLEHALQCAALAVQAHGDDELVAAALFHDIGHFCGPGSVEELEGFGVADHENIAARYLQERGFSPRVGKLISGHVQAKRYLVATNPTYRARLSLASVETLRQQGGPMTPSEADTFAADPDFKDLLRVRVWDEEAKRLEWQVPDFASYEPILRRLLKRQL